MTTVPHDPALPRLRPLDVRWIVHQGQDCLLLRDTLNLSRQTLLVPAPIAPLLGLMDGTRDADALGKTFALRTGYALPAAQVQ